jgi:hypothetical protein
MILHRTDFSLNAPSPYIDPLLDARDSLGTPLSEPRYTETGRQTSTWLVSFCNAIRKRTMKARAAAQSTRKIVNAITASQLSSLEIVCGLSQLGY